MVSPESDPVHVNYWTLGIMIRGEEHKTFVFADDVLLFITSPDSSIPKLMSLLNEYNSYSGYKLNIQQNANPYI